MENLSLIQKYKLFKHFKKILKLKRNILVNKENGLNLRIDNAQRIYTVVNCSPDVLKYGRNLAEKEIKEHIAKIEKIIIDTNLLQYVGVRDIEQITELDFLIVFGYKGFDTASFYTILYTTYAILGIFAIISLFYLFY